MSLRPVLARPMLGALTLSLLITGCGAAAGDSRRIAEAVSDSSQTATPYGRDSRSTPMTPTETAAATDVQLVAVTRSAVDPDSVAMGCPDGAQLTAFASLDFTRDGVSDAVVAAGCVHGAGTAPSTIAAFAATLDGPKRIDVLEQGAFLESLTVTGPRDLRVIEWDYSSDDLPRCCPDQHYALPYRFTHGKFRLWGEIEWLTDQPAQDDADDTGGEVAGDPLVTMPNFVQLNNQQATRLAMSTPVTIAPTYQPYSESALITNSCVATSQSVTPGEAVRVRSTVRVVFTCETQLPY